MLQIFKLPKKRGRGGGGGGIGFPDPSDQRLAPLARAAGDRKANTACGSLLPLSPLICPPYINASLWENGILAHGEVPAGKAEDTAELLSPLSSPSFQPCSVPRRLSPAAVTGFGSLEGFAQLPVERFAGNPPGVMLEGRAASGVPTEWIDVAKNCSARGQEII